METWERKWIFGTAVSETWGRGVLWVSSTALPSSFHTGWQPELFVRKPDCGISMLYTGHINQKGAHPPLEGSCHVSSSHTLQGCSLPSVCPDSLPFLIPCPWLLSPPSSLIFTSVSFILKPTEGLVKLCFLSKTNLGARGWTSHKFGERSTECFTLDSRKDFEREDRGREAPPRGRRRRAI